MKITIEQNQVIVNLGVGMTDRRHAAQRWLRPEYSAWKQRLLWVFANPLSAGADLQFVGRILRGRFTTQKRIVPKAR